MMHTAPLLKLLAHLHAGGYRFVTPTPLTHQRVLAHREGIPAATLHDIFGWSMAFEPAAIPPGLLALMDRAQVLDNRGRQLASSVRVSSIGDDLFAHSAYPTTRDDAVFFGPDTYRFARFVQQSLRPR